VREQKSDTAVVETAVAVGGVASEQATSSRYMQVLSLPARYCDWRFCKGLLNWRYCAGVARQVSPSVGFVLGPGRLQRACACGVDDRIREVASD